MLLPRPRAHAAVPPLWTGEPPFTTGLLSTEEELSEVAPGMHARMHACLASGACACIPAQKPCACPCQVRKLRLLRCMLPFISPLCMQSEMHWLLSGWHRLDWGPLKNTRC